jgi:hypothetical protein
LGFESSFRMARGAGCIDVGEVFQEFPLPARLFISGSGISDSEYGCCGMQVRGVLLHKLIGEGVAAVWVSGLWLLRLRP